MGKFHKDGLMDRPACFSSRGRATHGIAKAVVCGILLLVLPACGIPPLRKAAPPPALPPDFRGEASPESSARLGIEEFYRDPTLLGLVDQALTNNRELKILNEEVLIAANDILARSGTYLPFLTAGPVVGLDRASNRTIEGAALRADPFLPGQFFANPHGNYLLGLGFTWQIDIYRQLRNSRDAAAQRYVLAIERRAYFVTELVAEVADNYYELMALDKRLENLNQIIAFLEHSLEIARARKEFARDTELAVLRFEAEVRRNQSEKLIINQDIIETENRINFLANRFPQPVERDSTQYYNLEINALSMGVPTELLENRPDIRQAERDLVATGLDVKVARVNFYPQLILNAGTGLQSFNMQGLFAPQAVLGNVAGGFIGPLVNRRSIKAEYLTSNARQMQAIYNYQRTVLNAFTEVVNGLTAVHNYTNSVAVKKQQMVALENAVQVANDLFQFARIEYLDVLTAQRDLRDARSALIDTKKEQLLAIVNTYQALGGGTQLSISGRVGPDGSIPYNRMTMCEDDFRKLSEYYYASPKYYKALQAALQGPTHEAHHGPVGEASILPPGAVPYPTGGESVPQTPLDSPDYDTLPPEAPLDPTPPPADLPGPFDRGGGIREPAIETTVPSASDLQTAD